MIILEGDKQLTKVKLTELKNKSSLFGPELSSPAETAETDFDLNIETKEREEVSMETSSL